MKKTSLLTATLMAVVAATSAANAAPSTAINASPVKAETLKFEPFKGEVAAPEGKLYTGRSAYRDTGHNGYHGRTGHIGYVRGEPGSRYGHGRGYADLVGDRESGLGFYQLPGYIRAGAARYHYRTARAYWGPYGYGNPVQQAVVFDAIRNQAWAPASAVNGYRYGVYDPIDGVGTPFFAGYYSAGTRDASDGPEPLFGNPLD